MKIPHRYIILLLLTISIFICRQVRSATVGEETMVNLTLADGLAGETVYNMITDSNGYWMIATSGGVSVFDGVGLTTFRIKGEQGQILTVYDLCEVNQQELWAATEDGLYRMYKTSGCFDPILPEVQHPQSLLSVGDTVYIASQQGLLYYDGKLLHHIDVDVSHRGLNNIVRQYVKDENGQIWFLSRFDLNSFDPHTGKVTRQHPSLGERHVGLSQFAYAGKGRFVVGTTTSGLLLCDLQSGTTTRINGVGNIVSSVRRSVDGDICVATDGEGAFLLDGETLEIKERFNTEAEGRRRLPTNGTYFYCRNTNGVNCFGFVRCGMAYNYYDGGLFKPFRAGDFTSENIHVRSFCRHGDDVILGTQNGFHYANTQTGLHRYFSPADLGGAHVVNTLLWYDGCFYIGTFDGGLKVFDPQTLSVSDSDFSPHLNNVSVGDLKVGPDGRLWIGCTNGLMIVRDGKLEQHFTEQNSRIVGGLILSITFDASGNAWVTGYEGCSLYSVRSHEIVETTFPEGFFNKHPWMRGAWGHDGLVFMRTGPQTFYTNEQMTDFGELQFPVKFFDKWSRSFVDNMKGYYLIATERGVVRCSYDMKEVQLFGYGEGLRGDFINDMRLDDQGRLWVATSQGLYSASVQDLKVWQDNEDYKIVLYDIRRGSDLLMPNDEYMVSEDHSIRLRWNFTSEVLQMRPLLLDYSKQSGRLYEYRMDDQEWCLIDADDAMEIRRLWLGNHQLEVRLAGAQGTASVYTITVVPSVWAIVELALLVVALLLLWLWWRWRRTTKVLLSERDEIEDALVEMEQELQKEEEKEEPKYERVRIDEQECAVIVDRMEKYLEREKVFKNADLKMKDLANVMRLSAPKLSQVFNIYLGQNYYDYINRYRLDEFKRLIAEGEYKRFTITALSEQCGFKKSNFFSTFRKVEGMTPTEYLKKQGVNLK